MRKLATTMLFSLVLPIAFGCGRAGSLFTEDQPGENPPDEQQPTPTPTPGDPTPTETPKPIVIEVTLAGDDDDAEEVMLTGAVILNSQDLDLGTAADPLADTSDVMVGMRFSPLDIPPGALIVSAHVVFEAESSDTESTSLEIHAEQTSAAVFTDTDEDISSRTYFDTTVMWNDVEPWDNGEAYDSPDIATLVQALIDGDGWSKDGALGLLVTGIGQREAVSEPDGGSSAKRPTLVVEFQPTR